MYESLFLGGDYFLLIIFFAAFSFFVQYKLTSKFKKFKTIHLSNGMTGKEIAENLYNIYEFCKNGIMKGFTKKDSKLVYDAIPPIDEILDGWKQIK